MMAPGLYIARLPIRGTGSRLIIESVCFAFRSVPGLNEEESRDWVRNKADTWRQHVQEQHPKDDVFVIERLPVEDKE